MRLVIATSLAFLFIVVNGDPLTNIFDIFNIINHRQFDYLPNVISKVAKSDVKFFLYQNNARQNPVELNNERKYSAVDPRLPTKIFIHGWTENSQRLYYRQMTNSYFQKMNCNIIHIDWSVPGSAPYPVAVKNTKLVGEIIGKVVSRLNTIYNLPMENVHIIGHSLGAHVAGFAGKEIKRLTRRKIGRISGLDPAGPLFEGALILRDSRLCDEDATVVDVIHTDGGVFGFREPLGTMDFYPNGGVPLQPGCSLSNILTVFTGNLDGIFCSHTRSYRLFAESILSNDFIATKCDSWESYELGACNQMEKVIYGDSLNSTTRGLYYFRTNSQVPFARSGT